MEEEKKEKRTRRRVRIKRTRIEMKVKRKRRQGWETIEGRCRRGQRGVEGDHGGVGEKNKGTKLQAAALRLGRVGDRKGIETWGEDRR